MDAQAQLRMQVLSMVVRDLPRQFWIDLRGATRQAYGDVFQQILGEPNICDEQRIDLLRQRHYRMENVLRVLATKHGLHQSMTLLVRNFQHYAYVVAGDIGMTQSYVRAIGDLPQPKKFFEELASINEVPRLDLGDEPPEMLVAKSFYGLIAHNPVGLKFDVEEQKLGMIQFCIPTKDAQAWGVELSIEEILSAYPDERTAPVEEKPAPVWKDGRKDRKESDAA